MTLLCASAAGAQYKERIDVVRILLDVRVTDSRGTPITDLTTKDIEVRIGGKSAELESVEWIQDSGVERRPPSAAEDIPAPEAGAAPPGRLFVVFVQTDFAREAFRVRGQMDFIRYAEKMIEAFEPDDRVAVLQFDSHLKMRLDFTANKGDVNEALRNTLSINNPPRPPIVPEPSLWSRLDKEDMRRAPDSETGLLVLGNALRNIPGPKTILLIGWGLGRLSNGRVVMPKNYERARRALDAARTSIFAIDVPDSSSHTLEVGLQQAAADTGGMYVKTAIFPGIAVEMMQRALMGHYELEVRRPDGLEPGEYTLEVRVKRRGMYVFAPTTWRDKR
jgi:VWFA-related protein